MTKVFSTPEEAIADIKDDKAIDTMMKLERLDNVKVLADLLTV